MLDRAKKMNTESGKVKNHDVPSKNQLKIRHVFLEKKTAPYFSKSAAFILLW